MAVEYERKGMCEKGCGGEKEEKEKRKQICENTKELFTCAGLFHTRVVTSQKLDAAREGCARLRENSSFASIDHTQQNN